MNRFTFYIVLVLFFLPTLSANAQSRETVRTSGDVMALVTPVASLVTTLALKDYEGLKQGALAGVTTVATTYALKHIIQKKRPDGSNDLSFPSSHTSISFTGAAFIQRRYGWKWAFRHTLYLPMLAGAGCTDRNTIGGMLLPEPP